MYPRVLGSMHFEEPRQQWLPDQVIRSLSKDSSAMLICRWQQGMCRMFPSKRTKWLKKAGSMFVRLIKSVTKNHCD